MTIAEAIVAHLLANAGVSALAGTRVYGKRAPQAPTYPLVVIHKISGPSEHSQDGPAGLATPRHQIDCMGKKISDAVGLGEAVRVAMDGFQGTLGGGGGVAVDAIFIEDRRDDYDDDLEVHVYSQDFQIWHHE